MNRISDFRRKARITQTALAAKLDWSQGRLSNYEAGRRVAGLADCRSIVSALCNLGSPCSLDDVFPPADDFQQDQAA